MARRRLVLFVDDDPCFLDAMQRTFAKAPFAIQAEDSGEAALMAMAGQEVDVVVADNRMPGMGGVQLAAEIARQWPATVVIMLSGAYTTADLIAAINHGHVYKVLTKPCDGKELRWAILAGLRHKIEVENLYRPSPSDEYFPDEAGDGRN